MTRLGQACLLILAAIGMACLADGEWLNAATTLGISVFVVGEDKDLCRRRAKKDLREIYPPKRDQFQRDLERLNRMRRTPVRYEELTGLQSQREAWYWDSTSERWKPHPAPKSPRARHAYPLHDSVEILRSIMLGIGDGFRFMAPFLVVILFGAVVGLVVSLL